MPIITDFHNHVSYTSATAMIQSAREKGLQIFGLSEHIFQMYEAHPLLSFLPLEGRLMYVEDYRKEVSEAAQSAHFDVRVGLEVDFIPEKNAAIQSLFLPYSWDFLIGSVHDVDELHFDRMQEDPGRERGEALWLRYLFLLREAVTSGLFQVVSHPVRMYTTNHYLPANFDEELEHLAAEATRCDVALELNGYDIITYPEVVQRLVNACVVQRTPICCGSDAHNPREVGQAGALFETILRKAGIQHVRSWKQQKPEEHSL